MVSSGSASACASACASTPSIARLLAERCEGGLFQSLYHPFTLGLANGQLPMEKFKVYMTQDSFYLEVFMKAYAFALTKAPDNFTISGLMNHLNGVQDELKSNHAKYIDTSTRECLAKATKEYTDFLLQTAQQQDSVARILAAMAPCARLYAFLGKRLLDAAGFCDVLESSHPYGTWLNTYGCDGFEQAAQSHERLLDHTAAVEKISFEELLPLYQKAVDLELAFFEEFFSVKDAYSSALANAELPKVFLKVPSGNNPDKENHNREVCLHCPHVPKPATDLVPSNEVEIMTLVHSLQQQNGKSQWVLRVDESKVATHGHLQLELLEHKSMQTSNLPLIHYLVKRPSNQNASAVYKLESLHEISLLLKHLSIQKSCFECFSTLVHPTPTTPLERGPVDGPGRVLIIAGSDSGGGAGIQADLKTCTTLGVYSATAITAVTVQNSIGVTGIHPIPLNVIADQITCVLDDFGADAIKTGMLSNEETIDMVASVLKDRDIPLILDPVMVSTSGDRLLEIAACKAIVDKLFPLAMIITPNIPEASALLQDMTIETVDEMKEAARQLFSMGPRFVLVKGGHLTGPVVVDVLFDGSEFHLFESARVNTRNTHGTGCTLASAIASLFAESHDMVKAVRGGIAYVHSVLEKSAFLQLGRGDHGPMLHSLGKAK